jgi:ribokinase
MEKETKKVTVLGSCSIDTFMLIDRNPELGETISANELKTACGGKGANQASTIGKLGFKVDFVGQVGSDAGGETILNEIRRNNVNVDYMKVVENEFSGQAFIFLYPSKDNSIVIAGGSNMNWKSNNLEDLNASLSSSEYLLLQREIPEEINIKGAEMAQKYGVKVVLDMGGADTPISKELMHLLKIISPNRTELKRILNREIEIEDKTKLIDAVK